MERSDNHTEPVSFFAKPSVRIALATVAVMVFAVRFDPTALASFGSTHFGMILLAIILHGLTQVIGAIRWAGLARPVGFDLSLRRFVQIYLEARFLSGCLTSPAPGDLWRAWTSADTFPGRLLAACTVLADRLAGWAAIFVFSLTALGQRWFELSTAPTLSLMLGLMIAVLAIISIGMGVIRFLIMCLPKGHDLRGLTSRLIPYQARPQLIWTAFGWGLSSQLLNILAVVCLGWGLGIDAPVRAYFIAVPLTALSLGRPGNALSMTVGAVNLGWFLPAYGVPHAQCVMLEQSYLVLSLLPALVGGVFWLRGSFADDRTNNLYQRTVARWSPGSTEGESKSMSAAGCSSIESLSVVVPICNEAQSIRPLYAALSRELAGLNKPYEIILVDDGSTDSSHETMAALAADDDRVKVITLRRNFGQTAAMHAGIRHATGDAIITIDADLQNDPADIRQMLSKLDEGYDVVHGWRKNRHDGLLKRRIPSVAANWLISKVTGFAVRDLGCTLKVIRREFAQELQLYGEMHRFIPILAHWNGARCAEVVCRHYPRRYGQSKYGLSRTLRVLLDLITVKYMIQYFASPMKLFGGIGLGSLAVGAMSGVATLTMKLSGGIDMTGNPLLLLTVFAWFVSLQFFVLGMLGELCVRTYYESQNKQPYTIRRLTNFDRDVLPTEKSRAA